MATVEERMKVLKLIEDGKVTAEEGARLLAALDKSRQRRGRRADRAAAPPPGETNGRWIRLRVSDTRSGKTRVNMTLPLGLVNMGLAVGARFVPDIANVDVDQLQDMLRGGLEGKVLEVMSENGELVEIFVE